MTTQVQDLLRKIRPGEPLRHERLTVLPLVWEQDSPAEYLTIDDAIEQELADVEEVSDQGSVPEMNVHNRAGLPVLIPDGTALVGTKQNRVVNLSILLAAASDTVIPVSCVEQGRWSRASRKSATRGYSDKKLRMRMCQDTHSSLKDDGKVKVSQSGVWCHVQEMLGSAKAASPSHAYHAIYEQAEERLEAYERLFVCPEATCGAVVLLDGKVDSVDVFDKPATFRKVWPKLVQALAVGAVYGAEPDGQVESPDAFLEKAQCCKEESFAPVGIGKNVRLEGDNLVGAALVNDETVLHLSLFATPGEREADDTDPE